MKIHLTTGGTKRYWDSRTGREYRFDWEKFTDAALYAEDGISKAAARMAKDAHISEAVVNSHLRDRRWSSTMRFPEDIGIIRSYGMTLAGDEDAFLHPAAPAERPSPTAAAELKRQGEQERAALEYNLRYAGKNLKRMSLRQIVLESFTALWEILSLYGISDGYNLRPDTGGLEGAEEYFDALLRNIQEMLLNAGEMQLRETRETTLDITFTRLEEILRETKRFVKCYLFPGVDLRWHKINARLNYYDPVFDLLEELPPEAFKHEYSRFGYRPTQRDAQMRRLYFSDLEGQETGAVTAYFQEELLDTLVKIFERDFVWPAD